MKPVQPPLLWHDNRIRVGGMAELSGFDVSLNPAAPCHTQEMVTPGLIRRRWFAKRKFWTGATRPMIY